MKKKTLFLIFIPAILIAICICIGLGILAFILATREKATIGDKSDLISGVIIIPSEKESFKNVTAQISITQQNDPDILIEAPTIFDSISLTDFSHDKGRNGELHFYIGDSDLDTTIDYRLSVRLYKDNRISYENLLYYGVCEHDADCKVLGDYPSEVIVNLTKD